MTAPGEIDLTPSEKAFLQARREIRIGVMANWPPMNFLNTSGQPDGIGAGYIKALNRRLGGILKIVPGDFSENLEQVRARELDGLMDVTPKPEREVFLNFTRVYLNIPHVIVAPEDGPGYNNEDDLTGKILALEKGFGNVKFFREKYPAVKIREYPDTAHAIGAAARGEADAYAGNRAVAAYLMEQELISNLRFHGRLRKPGSILTIGVRKDWPELVSILNKALAVMPHEEIRAIHLKWTGFGSKPVASQKVVATQQEIPPQAVPATHYKRLIGYLVTGFLLISLMAFILIRILKRENVVIRLGSSWFRRLVLAGLSIFILIVALLGWLTIEINKKMNLQAVDENLRQILSVSQDRLNLWLDERYSDIISLGRDPKLVTLTKRLLQVEPVPGRLLNSTELQDMRSFFNQSRDILSNTGVFIISPELITIGAMRDGDVGAPNLIARKHSKLLQQVFNEVVVPLPIIASELHPEEPSQSKSQSKPHSMFFVGPVQDTDGRFLAVLMVQVAPWKDFARAMKFFGSSGTGETYIFDRNGCMLSPSRFETQLRRIGLLPENRSSSLNIEIRDPGVNMINGERPDVERSRQPLTLMVSRALSLRNEMRAAGVTMGHSPIESNLDGYNDYRGMPVFGAWRWCANLNIGIAAEIDKDAALARFYQIRLTIMGILGFTLLLSSGAILFVLIVGEHTSRALIRARDNLEAKVAERTAELKDNQERFEALLESAPDAMVVSKASGEIVLINSQAEHLFGYQRDELLGSPVERLVSEKKKKAHSAGRQRFLDEAAVGVISSESELTARAKDGTRISVDISLSPLKTADGVLVVASIRDITERKRMEEALFAERERLQQILDTSPAGVVITTKEKVCFANPRIRKLFGVEIGDPSPAYYVHPEERTYLIDKIEAEGKVENYDLKIYDRNHAIRDVLVNYIRINYNGEKSILAWLLDITDRKSAEREIEEKFDELARFRRLAVGRELKMIDLKKEINTLSAQLGRGRKYKIVSRQVKSRS
ncbi:hypothetical protein DSCO28_34670 [Desulfosarcina ovata subsp. sediminis]|uniref:Histidine kinase n=1 Tax=Desulfosarcina ovata subsp. sediminis TaxID=885957 RepID=A0A5K7ZNR8_9BACT|nr:hypothetical protein DSCO28_34670 [Desulfosarcina ovata subsp. sediminis]